MVNRVILVGTLTRDAESLQSARGLIARMRIATTSQWRDADGNRQEGREFHNLVAVAPRLAEICSVHCLRGHLIYVEGRLRTREYDGSDGLSRTSTEVVIDTMRVLDRHEHAAMEGLHVGGSIAPIPAGSARPDHETAAS